MAGRHSEKGVRNRLHRLVGQGIVNVRPAGKADLYSLNRRHLAAPSIVALAGLRHELLARIRAELAGGNRPPSSWCCSGALAAATGRMRPDSDIDLLVVRPKNVDIEGAEWRLQLETLSTDVTAWTGNDTRLLQSWARTRSSGAWRVVSVCCPMSGTKASSSTGKRPTSSAAPRKEACQPWLTRSAAPRSARAGRMAKARQFLVAAETIATVIDDQEKADMRVVTLRVPRFQRRG